MAEVLSAAQVQALNLTRGRDRRALIDSHEQLRENGKAISDLTDCYRIQAQEAEDDLREQVAITETWIARTQAAEAAVRAGGNAADALRRLVSVVDGPPFTNDPEVETAVRLATEALAVLEPDEEKT